MESVQLKKYQILSGSALKVIAAVTMLIDHVASYLMTQDPIPLFSIGRYELTVYFLMRFIGRTAFPIFCFLLVEGFHYTRSRKTYALNLFVFAVLSEIPWDLIHTGRLISFRTQSVYVTLLLGFCGLWVLDRYKEEKLKKLLLLGVLFYCSIFFHCDYGFHGIGLILVLELLRDRIAEKTIVGCCIVGSSYMAPIGFLPILLYNGKRGFIQGRIAKYAFYAFYPVHLLVLYFIMVQCGLS